MDPQVQKQIKDLQSQLDVLTKTMNFHQHTGADTTNRLPVDVYPGMVASGGTAGTVFPLGWKIALASSVYTITHNLNNLNYVVTATISAVGFIEVSAITATSFKISTFNSSASATNAAFSFNLRLQTNAR